MKKIIASALLALGLTVGVIAAPANADDTDARTSFSQRALDWM